jgi:lysophospholipase L1-like esterase
VFKEFGEFFRDFVAGLNSDTKAIKISHPTLMLQLRLLLVWCATFGALAAAEFENLAHQKVVFLGDSITQAGGYVSFADYYLQKTKPALHAEVYGLGLSSETLSGLSEPNHANGAFPRPCLFERLGRLLERMKPDVVFACYGMNDGIYLPLDDGRFAAFKKGVHQLIDQCHAAGVKQVYLITPPIYDRQTDAAHFNYDTVLTAYAAWEMTLKESGLTVIDLHTAMRKARETRTEVFSKDGVHPGDEGHWLMAKTVLSSLGLPLPELKLAEIQADPVFKQVDLLRRHRATHWMNYVGYTRQKTVPPTPLGAAVQQAQEIQQKIDELLAK